MKPSRPPSLDLIDARRRLVAMRSAYSDDRRITTLINRLMGRLAHLNETEDSAHEQHLRKIITEMIERVEQIASHKQLGKEPFSRHVIKRSRKTGDAKLTAEETTSHLGRPVSSPKSPG
jgi:hypothetical protein